MKKLSDIDFKSEEYKDFTCHPDVEYVEQFLGTRGSAYSMDGLDKPITVGYIFGKNKFEILWINILLRIRFYKRKYFRK